MATKNGVPYVVNLASSDKWNVKCPFQMNAKKITVHNTDNSAAATNEASYHNGNWNEVSFHLAIDEVQAIQVLPFYRNAWASGDGANGYGNRNTIHVEICKNYDRNTNSTNLGATQQAQYVKAEANAVKVIAQLCVDLGIVANTNNIKRHYDWNGKWCPSKILNEGRWNIVQALIIGEYNRLVNGGKPAAKPAPSKPTVKPAQKTVTLANWAVKYQTGQTINPTVKGKKYAVIQEKTVNQSKSKKAYLLGGIMSWVLEQDTVEFEKKPTPTPSKPAETASFYTSNPQKVKLKVSCSLYGRNDVNFKGGASGGVYPAGTVFTISGMTKSDGGTPRLITQSGFLLTANKKYVEAMGGLSPKPAAKPTPKLKGDNLPNSGSYKVAFETRIRSNPTTKSQNVVGTYSVGQSFNYDKKVVAEGYVWLSYVSFSGARRYVAVV